MELREFAETILYGKNLIQDKLLQPEDLTDDNPGKEIFAPQYPGRPKDLTFGKGHSNQKYQFPNQNEVEKERERGVILHFFANHELLAMELMALALLRFPHAPKKFRMGIAKTIKEEQRHMQMYLKRMKDFQVSFGEIPVNDFFWKALSNMSSPLDYVAKLSMTFEQANLDFSLFYMNLMKKIGDMETAKILNTVYEEEIGHVKHGVIWFDKWRDQSQSQWECYMDSLSLPITPARAKGILFDKEARIKAGLNLHFINELFVFSASKGRPPDIYFFNPCCELEVERNKPGFTPVKSVQYLQEDCASLCLFLSAKDDIVLVPRKPSTEFLKRLKFCGFDLPEWHVYNNHKISASSFPQNVFGSLQPWGMSPDSLDFLKDIANRCKKIPSFLPNLYSKVFSTQLTYEIHNQFKEFDDVLTEQKNLPIIANNTESLIGSIKKILAYANTVVLKLPYSSSGQNMVRVHSAKLSLNEINWVEKNLAKHPYIIVEPWFPRVVDFSTQLKIELGRVIYLDSTRLLNDKRGQYQGTILGKKTLFLNDNILKFLYTPLGNSKINFNSLLKQVSIFAGEKLLELGFEGSFGLDVFIYQDPYSRYGFRIKFISEINPRFTMGRVALEIGKRIVPGVASLWTHIRIKDIEKKFGSKEEFIEKMSTQFPLETTSAFKPQIKSGILFTNDILQAKNTATILIVGQENIEKFIFLNSLDLLGRVPEAGSRIL